MSAGSQRHRQDRELRERLAEGAQKKEGWHTHPQAWIEKRLRSIVVRGELTDEWKQRGVKEGKEYGVRDSYLRDRERYVRSHA